MQKRFNAMPRLLYFDVATRLVAFRPQFTLGLAFSASPNDSIVYELELYLIDTVQHWERSTAAVRNTRSKRIKQHSEIFVFDFSSRDFLFPLAKK